MSTGSNPAVRSPTAARAAAGSRFGVTGSTSQNAGVAPSYRRQFDVATKLSGVVILLVAGPQPCARTARCSAAVRSRGRHRVVDAQPRRRLALEPLQHRAPRQPAPTAAPRAAFSSRDPAPGRDSRIAARPSSSPLEPESGASERQDLSSRASGDEDSSR